MPTLQHISSSTYQLFNISTLQHINSSTYQLFNISALQHINSSTFQRFNRHCWYLRTTSYYENSLLKCFVRSENQSI
ncbi:hypothetical protein EB796_011098 [Bugula neritina]|uniref:Uncharacterized protein n=1 Tax=Bugula neritina TaxID=10212 RepID=A0A7J7JW30_BUGNE|nr:hypothetical protein EB796_011098 [Bugula neritina]